MRGALLGATLSVVALVACAGRSVAPPPAPTVSSTTSEGGGSIQQTNVVTATATVQAIDHARRTVTLLGPEGDTLTIEVGPEVRNLAQVKTGDLVVVRYRESIALELRRRGDAEPGIETAEIVGRAAPGERPAGGAADAITVTTKIVKLDRRTQKVTLEGPEGRTTVVTVRDPSRLDDVDVGDLVEITYTRALAIAVDPAPAQ